MKKTPHFTSRSLFFVILTSYKVQTPYYFFDFWRILARERLQITIGVMLKYSVLYAQKELNQEKG